MKTGQLLARFSLLFGLVLATPAVAQTGSDSLTDGAGFSPELQRVRTLVRGNVLGLARELLETQGPPLRPTSDWLQWERQLWALYRVQGEWERLYQRTRKIPPAFPRSIRFLAEMEAIGALNALGDGDRARFLARKNLLSSEVSDLEKRSLRESIIESYLADDMLPAAATAMRHYQHDYRAQDDDWLVLSARVYLQNGDPDTAINLLAPVDRPDARVLGLYARLRNASLEPPAVVEQLMAMSDNETGAPIRDVLAVRIEANRLGGADEELVRDMEAYLTTYGQNDSVAASSYPVINVQDLFDAYARVAQRQANNDGLLIGEESRWLEYARNQPQEARTVRRSLFAYLAFVADNMALYPQAVDEYVNELIEIDQTALLHEIFGDANPGGSLTLGGETGLRLSNHALEQGDVELAAQVNANLAELPAGMDRNQWLLHAGRISVIAGRPEEGAARLEEWLAAHPRLDAASADAVLQPVFDLQAVGQHELALGLLTRIQERAPGGKYPREIAYWLAESLDATGEHIRAADLFLYSALLEANGFDQWGESARYRAAEALTRAGIYADARQIYEDMKRRSEDDARRADLDQKLQKLWLLESNSGTGDSG